MPHGNRTLGQVYYTRFELEDGTYDDPTEVVIIRREPGAEEGEWVIIRPLTPADDGMTVSQLRTSLGRSVEVFVDQTERLYLRLVAPSGWGELPLARFGLGAGETVLLESVENLPVSVEIVDVPTSPGLPRFHIGSPDAHPLTPQPSAPPGGARQLGAAPIYAAGVGGPAPWDGARRAPQPPVGAEVESGVPPSGEAPAPTTVIGLPEIQSAISQMLGTVQVTMREERRDAEVTLAEKLGAIASRLERLELRGPRAATQAEDPGRPHAPGVYFAPPARVNPATGGATASVDDAAVAAGREALGLGGGLPSESGTLAVSPPATGRVPLRPSARSQGPLTVSDLLGLIAARASLDDIGALLRSDADLGGAAAQSGARGLAALERARCDYELQPKLLWDFVLSQILRRTQVRGGGLLAYFEGSPVQHHELALFFLHLLERISVAAQAGDGNAVLGFCGAGITFLDQAGRDNWSLRLASELSLLRDPELPYLGPENDAAKRARAAYGKPFSPLVNPSTFAAVTAAFKDIEVLTKASAPPKGKGKGAQQ